MKTLKFTLLTLLFAMAIVSCSKKDEPISSSTIVTPPKKDTTVVTPPNTPILPQTTIDSIKGKLLKSQWTNTTGVKCIGSFLDMGNNILQFSFGQNNILFLNLNQLSNPLIQGQYIYSGTLSGTLNDSSNDELPFICNMYIDEFTINTVMIFQRKN